MSTSTIHKLGIALIASMALIVGAAGCGDDSSTPTQDTGKTADTGGGNKDGGGDTGGGSDSAPNATSLKVAGIQFAVDQAGQVDGCANAMCALTKLISIAAQNGAKIIVTPEYQFGQTNPELSPDQGDVVLGDSRWPDGKIIQSMAKLANKLGVTIIFNLITQAGTGNAAKLYNTQLAVDANGKILARHYKFHLFGNEATQLTAGTDVATNFFDTPAGKVGLLICADIQCVVTGGVSPDCSKSELDMLKLYVSQKAVATFFSTDWTVGPTNAGSSAWWPLNVQKKFSVDANQWVIAANTSSGPGQGGGIFKPGGEQVDASETGKPNVVYGELPLKK